MFTVSRLIPDNTTATVVYSTTDGTATVSDNDYVPTTGTLTFQPGDTTMPVTVMVKGDTKDENDETFNLTLSNPVNATASTQPGVATIVNDDSAPLVTITAPASPTPEVDTNGQNGMAIFTVSLSQASGKQVTVAYQSASESGDTATPVLDYTPTSGVVTFAPGTTTQKVTVQILGDNIVEPTETFHVELSNPQNATLGAASTAQGSILDVPPAIITGQVYADLNNDGQREASEGGIAGVTITAVRSGTPADVETTTTDANGQFSFTGLVPGTWSIIETQPGFFVDGKDTHNGVLSSINDEFTNIVLAPSQAIGGFNFGEQGLRAEFVSAFLDRRAFFASTLLNGGFSATVNPTTAVNLLNGDVWVSFDGGFDGARTIQALFSSGTATMTLYNNSLQAVAISAPNAGGAVLQYTGTLGAPYFLKVTGSATSVTFTVTGGPTSSSLGGSSTPSVATAGGSTSSSAANVLTSTFASSAASSATPSSASTSDLAFADDEDWLY